MAPTRLITSSVLVGLLAWAGVATAQPADQPTDPPPTTPSPPGDPTMPPAPDPAPAPAPAPQIVEPPPAAPVVEAYPRSLVLRPIVLPGNAIEGTALLGLLHQGFGSNSISFYTLDPRVRYGLPGAELELGVSLLLTESSDMPTGADYETLRSVFLAGRFVVMPDVTVGAEMTFFTPAGDAKTYAPRLVGAHKIRTSSRSAVFVSLAGGIDRIQYPDTFMVDSFTAMVGAAEIRAQAQVIPALAVEGRAALSYSEPIGEDMGFGTLATEGFSQDYGLRLVGAVSEQIDVLFGYDILYTGAANAKQYTLGVAARRLP